MPRLVGLDADRRPPPLARSPTPRTLRIHPPALTLVMLTPLPQHRRPSQPVPGPASSQSPDVVPSQSVRRRGRLGARWDSRLGIRTDKVVSRPSPHFPLGEPYSDGDWTSPSFPMVLGMSTDRVFVCKLHIYCILTADPCRPTHSPRAAFASSPRSSPPLHFRGWLLKVSGILRGKFDIIHEELICFKLKPLPRFRRTT